jgi:hypothetical protein
MLDPRPERRPTAAAASGGPNGTDVDQFPGRERGRGKKVAVVAAVVTALVAAVVTGVALYQTGGQSTAAPPAGPKAPLVTTPTTLACTPLLYQRCGQDTPAPGTDGSNCLAGRADFDGTLANGCEAATDYQPDQALVAGQPVRANLVPATAVDVFASEVSESFFNLCLSKFRVTLTAPPGTTDKVEIIRDGRVLASATSTNLEPATAAASKPSSCFDSGSTTVTVQVSAVAGQSAEDFRLVSSGSW